ncbi:MAG: type II toxin-antitoxin system HicA family toxin [Anaerolinea sp.]|nr:type II toxin-antitoxin system HicA family toxin [Anaerolinea sp.]
MSKRDKLRRKLRNNPKAATKQDVETLLGHFGYILDHVTGSHHVYLRETEDERHRIVIPFHGTKVKALYVKLVLTELDEIAPEKEETEGESDGEQDA